MVQREFVNLSQIAHAARDTRIIIVINTVVGFPNELGPLLIECVLRARRGDQAERIRSSFS